MGICRRHVVETGLLKLKTASIRELDHLDCCMFKSLAKRGKSSYASVHKQHSVTKVKEPFHCKLSFWSDLLGKKINNIMIEDVQVRRGQSTPSVWMLFSWRTESDVLMQLSIYGNKNHPDEINRNALELTLHFIHETGQFDWSYSNFCLLSSNHTVPILVNFHFK